MKFVGVFSQQVRAKKLFTGLHWSLNLPQENLAVY